MHRLKKVFLYKRTAATLNIIHCLKKHMYSKKNAKYLSVKQEGCHFANIHFNFSHATPIQGIIQAVVFCLLLHACQFK